MKNNLSFRRFSRIIFVNEIRDLLNMIFPPRKIADKLGRNASWTGTTAIAGVILSCISVFASYPAFTEIFQTIAGWGMDISPFVIKSISLTLSIAIAFIMFVAINLFGFNVWELITGWGSPSWAMLIIALCIGVPLGYFDNQRMIDGSEFYAEKLVGNERETVLPMEPAQVAIRNSYMKQIAEIKQSMSWCKVGGHGKGVLVDQGAGLEPSVSCGHKGCLEMTIGHRNQSAWHKGQYQKIDELHAAAKALDAAHLENSRSYRELSERRNQERGEKLTDLKQKGKRGTGVIYLAILFLSLSGSYLYVEAAKRAGVSIEDVRAASSGEYEDESEIIAPPLSNEMPLTGFAQAHHRKPKDPESFYRETNIGFHAKIDPKNHNFSNEISPNLRQNAGKIKPKDNSGKNYSTKAAKKVEKAMMKLKDQGEKITPSAVANLAGVHRDTAKKWISELS